MKIIRLSMLLMASAFALSACSRQPHERQPESEDALVHLEPNEVLISINGVDLTYGDAVRQVERRLGGPPPASMDPARVAHIERQVFGHVVDEFIRRELLLAEARKLGISPDPQEVDRAVATIQQNVREGQPPPTGLVYDGPDSLRREVYTGMKIEKLLAQELQGAVEPTDEELEQFIADHDGSAMRPAQAHARHIFMAVPVNALDDQVERIRQEMEAIRAKLLQGSDFAELARVASQDPAARNGGELGLITQGRGDPLFERHVFAQEPNIIGPVVRSDSGFHIIQLHDRVDQRPATREEILDLIRRQKRAAALARYIQKLRQQADIKHSPAIRPLPAPSDSP